MNSTLMSLHEIDLIETAKTIKCDINEISKYMIKKNSDLTIITQNIRSVYSNLDDLQITLSQLDFDIDIQILTECRLKDNKPVPNIPQHKSFTTTNHINQADGVVVYVKNHHKVQVKEIFLQHASCLQILLNDLAVIAIYRSPSNANADIFIESLNEHLKTLVNHKNIIVTGDININLIPDIDEQSQDRKNRLNYLDMLSFHGVSTGHTLPTRYSTCLDHCMLRLKANKKGAFISVLETTVTDHFLVLINLTNIRNLNNYNKTKRVIDCEGALRTLEEKDIKSITQLTEPNVIVDKLINVIKDSIDTNTKSINISRSKRTCKPWITTGILRCIRNRNKMQKNLRANPENEILKISYRRYRNYVNNLIKKLKRAYEREELAKAKSNPKDLWNTINNIAHFKPSKSSNIDLLYTKPTVQESINDVNVYFAEVGSNLANELNTVHRRNIQTTLNLSQSPSKEDTERFPNTSTILNNYSTEPQSSSFVLLDTDIEETRRVLMNLKSDSAPGWDGITTKFLKLSHKLTVPIICHLANICFKQGKFPSALKQAIITPVHKGGDRGCVNNYRPISVLTSISKILEKLINSRLVNFLNKFNILSNSQFGFRQKLSTEDAILTLTSEIVQHVDKGDKCLAVFLDLKKAFDTVSVPTLVLRLEKYGIRGVPLALFTDYLQNRKQQVKIDDYVSDLVETSSFGVPQGSVLGPTLFLLYINELCNMKIPNSKIISYADDTAIIFSGKSWDDVQKAAVEGLSIVKKWLDTNLLTLNIKKSNFICFTPNKRTQPDVTYQIKLHTCESFQTHARTCTCLCLERVSTTRYLGVIIDEHLSWHPHLDMLMNRIRKITWVFKKLRDVTTKELITKIYIALAQSVLCYAIPVWGGSTKIKFLEVERTQRRLLKVMFSLPFRHPTEELYKHGDILTVRQLYILFTVLKLHKKLHYDPKILNKRRKYKVAPTILAKTAFAGRQFTRQASHLYNKINKVLNIYPLTSHSCKRKLVNWLKLLSYLDTETVLKE